MLVAGFPGRLLNQTSGRRAARSLPGRFAGLTLALALSVLIATPAVGAEASARDTVSAEATHAASLLAPRTVAQDDTKDATDGGYVPQARQVVFPGVEVGLTRQRPIPLGVTCSCTIDRTGLTSQFDITVVDVTRDAIAMVQQLNRFNRPPRPGAHYVAAYVGQQYIAGPRNQAYTTSDADWHATTTDERLSDTAQLFHTETEYRPRADVFPGDYVNGWLIFELPLNRPAFLVWNYNFVGERGVWFALQ